MNPNHIPKPEEGLDELDMETMSSVDDFIKELEAKERDLHITADLTIEIAEADFTIPSLEDLVESDLVAAAEALQERKKPAPSGNVPGAKTRIYELEQEIVKLNERIAELRSDRLEIQEKSDRRLKDFESYKYRMDRERRGSFIDQISNLASQMLPVLDNLDRALDSADKLDKKSDDFQQFFDGIVLVNQQVNEVFIGMGVTPIATVGETFDPNFHEAVAAEERDDVPHNTVTEEMLRGYRIGNRVIRHSMVKVTSAKKATRSKKSSAVGEPTATSSAVDDPKTGDTPSHDSSSDE